MGSLMKWQEIENALNGAIPIQLREGANSTGDRLIRDRNWDPHPGGLRELCVSGWFAQ